MNLNKNLKNIFYIVVGFVCLVSIYLKYDFIDYLVFRHNAVLDIEHFKLATNLLTSYISDAPTDQQEYRDFMASETTTKYPLLLTRIYLWAGDLIKDQVEFVKSDLKTYHYAYSKSAGTFIWLTCLIHCLFYVVILGVVLLLPISFHLRMLTLLLLSISFITHEYVPLIKVHGPLGTFVFLCFFFSDRMIRSQRLALWTLLASLSLGCAISTFYTGVIGLLPIFLSLFLNVKSRKLSIKKYFGLILLILLVSVFIFNQNHLAFSSFFRKEGNFFTSDYWYYIGGENPRSDFDYLISPYGGYTLKGFQVYFYDFIGREPFLYSLGVVGLWALWKSKKWKNSFWLLSLVTIFPYLMATGWTIGNGSRRMMTVMPLICLISAYGLSYLWFRSQKWLKGFLVIMVVFTFITIIRYNYLAFRDTRFLAFQYIRENISEGSSFLLDSNLPDLTLDWRGDEPKLYYVIWIDALIEEYYQMYESDENLKNEIDRHYGGSSFFETPASYAYMVKKSSIDYYVLNSAWRQNKFGAKDTSEIVKRGTLIKKFEPLEGHGHLPSSWTALPNYYHFFLWKLWLLERTGPTIEIYSLKSL